MEFLDSYFKISERKSTISHEVMGGITTFLAMAYIIIVNPSVLSLSGMDKGALITVTCLASFIGTIIAGVWANSPIALAPGMGLNAFFYLYSNFRKTSSLANSIRYSIFYQDVSS